MRQHTASIRAAPKYHFDSHAIPITRTLTPSYARKPDNLRVGRVAHVHI